ncbi:hypothetical protein PHYBOEH_005224 [Phytophthora boehmeriae]|uniref:Amino acid transporter transmembrane domain-containing protein n=1 Tax=Phytophthora boehmeriae TaxID=109152 RepID=A0A8T1WKI1_9STRA|nr:hypothetical protein PHYBOEH_005224 [Phytophthora boehmeriae]
MGVAPLGFTTDRGAVVMAYLFMHVHISIAFSTLMQPPFYMAERLILGMHPAPQIVRFSKDAQVDVDLEQDLQESKPYVQCSTPIEHEVSTSSIVEKTEGQVSHLLTEEQLAAPYEGAKNKLRYITLRLCIIVVLVIIAVLAQNKFLNLEDFTGATAHTTSCLLMPLIIYLRVFWKSMSVYDKAASMIVIVVCAFTGCYVMIHAAEELFTPSDDDTLFPYCETELQNTPYYVYNNSTKKMVSAAGVLLWTTHSLLREHNWAAQGSEGDNERLQQVETFSEDVNLLPAQIYALPNTKNEVHVRGLVVGTKLYLHFVSDEKSVRLILSISEYVKAREAHVEEDLKSVLVVDGWRCNVEILRWRLERNLFPEFSSETNLVASDAELCRLPPPLLVCVGGFLTAPELCRVTQTGKVK